MDESGGAREEELLRQIESTFPTLDRWQQVLSTGARLSPASELAADDSDWPWAPASQMAWAGLASARDHLHAVRVHIEALEMFPTAQSTLVRGALVGASQCVWILESDDPAVRRRRAQELALETYKRHLEYVDQAIQSSAAGLTAKAPLVRERLTERRQQLTEKLSAAGKPNRFTVTPIIELAAEATFGDPALTIEAVLEWRSTSGAAHGLVWPLLGRPDTAVVTGPDEHGMATHEAGGGLHRIGNGYLCAYWMTVKGWRLWQQRGGVELWPA